MARKAYSQAPDAVDLTLTGDDGWSIRMAVTDTSDGSAIDLSGYDSLHAAVLDGGTTVQAITIANTDLAGGIIDLSLTTAETDPLAGRTYTWAFWWVDGGEPFTAVAGMFKVLTRGSTA